MTEQAAPTTRQQRKADRRESLLTAAKRLFAQHGYLSVRLDDIGQAAGISGPAVYRHFASKDAVLAAMLVDISHALHEGGRRIQASARTPHDALRGLVEWQLDFALSEPELIVIHDRDRFHLPPDDFEDVRRTQRAYLEIWVEVIAAAVPSGSTAADRTRVHAVLGLINSAPRTPRTPDTHARLTEMALAAFSA